MGLMGVVREYADRVRRTTCSAVQLLSLGRFPSVYVIYKTRKTAWKEENLPISITGNTVFSYFLFFLWRKHSCQYGPAQIYTSIASLSSTASENGDNNMLTSNGNIIFK